MPELPEVETVKNELAPHLIGHKFTDITLLWDKVVKQPSAEDFRSRLIGQEITGLSRRGKYLSIHLSRGDELVIHLKMSGSLLIGKGSSAPPKHTRAIIHLDGGTTIFFSDPRKFGAMWLVKDSSSITGNLGPEPLEASFSPEVLAKRLHNRQAPIKALLCDQSVIAGIGNMYADEALFYARIHPLRQGGSLSPEEIARLHQAIQQVLRTAIGNKGASMVNYYRPSGETGTAHFEFKVAHQGGKNCPVCHSPIQRIKVRNRGTYFCPKCQPAP
ncbi:MAG TPA: bifunctional DNA-formamidopyrimidine glycosylase/DNA-(apurinic or apyrimidinic site) lyase [Dehalococcoidia bacterium]|jgi:formamidopyrimidine-DNA glycosylase|nr:bifunctional DNA-formamidopyrimidine glycosylase/DNA-(apurinic or apyrimidinic site) lyase [Dehalococcoidia bacterium]